MRVGLFNHTNDISGAEISLLLNAKHMKQAEPVLFAPEGELLERAREWGIQVVPTPCSSPRLSKNPLQLAKGIIGMLRSGYRFARIARREKIDLIHANSLRAGMIASLFGWLHRLPVIWHVRDMPPQGVIGSCIRLLARLSARRVIGISRPVVEGMGGNTFPRVRLIHNGVELADVTREDRWKHRQQIREELATPEMSSVFMVVGQIAYWKRQEDAIRAAALLAKQGNDIYLWIVGEAKFREENIRYEEQLRRLSRELGLEGRVRFTGFRKDIVPLCCAADALILCSKNEPFGRVIVEAMSQSLPVVATNGGGVPEIIEHGVSGLLYETADVSGLVESLSLLLHHDILRQRIRENGLKRVRDFFTIERTVKRIEELYDSVLGKRAADAAKGRSSSQPRVAIVHDYLNQMGGAERVVAVLHRMYPEAPIFTTIADRDRLLPELRDADIRTTWMQRIPGILKRFKHFFWLYPFAVRSMNLKGYDIILSSSSAYGKGAQADTDAVHVCYCHTPMRFAWDFDAYMESSGVPALLKWTAKLLVAPLRKWDVKTSKKIQQIVANSTVVQQRIKQHYGVLVPVIYPPVNISRFRVQPRPEGDFFLVVSRLVSYKRIDLAVEACTIAGMKLIVIGDGPDRKRLEAIAGPTVTFMGRLPDEEVVRYMENCRAFLFPGIEDFGITPLEANACGRPVIALRAGGALDTVIPGVNGTFFEEQTSEALAAVLLSFQEQQYNPAAIRKHAEQFGENRYMEQMYRLVEHAKSSYTAKPAFQPAAEAKS